MCNECVCGGGNGIHGMLLHSQAADIEADLARGLGITTPMGLITSLLRRGSIADDVTARTRTCPSPCQPCRKIPKSLTPGVVHFVGYCCLFIFGKRYALLLR